MKIVVISDTHGDLAQIKIPDGDLLLHCGDLSSNGTRDSIRRVNDDLAALPHKHKIVIAGNHDEFLETDPDEGRKLLSAVIYLQDEEVVIDGIKIYGTPWVPAFKGWNFNLPRNSDALGDKWMRIPADTDILMSHCPPAMILDRDQSQPLGCDLLRYVIDTGRITPVLHCFGHVHRSYGGRRLGRTYFVNAAAPGRDDSYNAPVVLDWDELKAAHASGVAS